MAAAREAKSRLRPRLGEATPVGGVGIERCEGGFRLKVSLRAWPSDADGLPREVDGVPVRYELVGPVRAL